MLYVAQVGLGAVSGVIPFLPVMAGIHIALWRMDRRDAQRTPVQCADAVGRNRGVHPAHIAGVYIFCCALLAILSVTEVPSVWNFGIDINVNLIPFLDIGKSTDQYVMNALLFVPVGFMLPLLWKRYESPLRTFLCGFWLSLAIEVGQLFCARITDIDDLLMNALGTLIGYGLWLFIWRCRPGISRCSLDAQGRWRWEPIICFLLAWFVMIALQPLVAGLFPRYLPGRRAPG